MRRYSAGVLFIGVATRRRTIVICYVDCVGTRIQHRALHMGSPSRSRSWVGLATGDRELPPVRVNGKSCFGKRSASVWGGKAHGRPRQLQCDDWLGGQDRQSGVNSIATRQHSRLKMQDSALSNTCRLMQLRIYLAWYVNNCL